MNMGPVNNSGSSWITPNLQVTSREAKFSKFTFHAKWNHWTTHHKSTPVQSSVVLVAYPQTSMIQDQVKEGKSLCWDWATIKDIKYLSDVVSSKRQVLFV